MRLMHSDAAASDDSLSPLLGRGEGGGEGQTFSRLNQPLTPALPVKNGEREHTELAACADAL
jgi:hypothetical protein